MALNGVGVEAELTRKLRYDSVLVENADTTKLRDSEAGKLTKVSAAAVSNETSHRVGEGRHMYRATWFVQYLYLFIANVGTIVLGGESLKAIATALTDETPQVPLPGWVGVAGAVTCIFAFLVPTLHALRFFSTCCLLLSSIFTFISISIAFSDGLKANGPRDYTVKGNSTANAFNAMGAVATIAFAYNTGVLLEMQIYCSPIYEFMDTYFEKKGSYGQEWSTRSIAVRLITRTTYIALSTFLGALLSFFGDFIALTGAFAAFPLESGLVHHMYHTSFAGEGQGLFRTRLAWHWGMVVLSGFLMVGTISAGFRFIVADSINYHAFATHMQ